MISQDTFFTRSVLEFNDTSSIIYDLNILQQKTSADIASLPKSLKILLENLLRWDNGSEDDKKSIEMLASWSETRSVNHEIRFHPARVLMQDFTGVPAIVDLAAMRDAVVTDGKNPDIINPQIPIDLVIDHSVSVDTFGKADAFEQNVRLEMLRNKERYRFLKWGQKVFKNFRVVPPGTGICHQVNLEYLASVVQSYTEAESSYIFPDTLVGTDSHTTMINGLGVLGWGVGGIEAEAAMLGQPISLKIPDVVGFKLAGVLPPGCTATDLVLTIVQMLRNHGVVGKFVEFFGDGLAELGLADRATISNMAPEYGATCGFFPVDVETLRYMALTGRPEKQIQLVETYSKNQGLWRQPGETPQFTDILELDISSVTPSLAGPKRPQDRVSLSAVAETFASIFNEPANTDSLTKAERKLQSGDVVLAAITSCTNTSNSRVMLTAGLLARNAVAKGLKSKPWVKTSLAPGSRAVTRYLQETDVQKDLDRLGFNLVGYGCTTCIGNSGPLPDTIREQIERYDLSVCSVLSGNRNFEGRVHQQIKGNWLASPPLVVAYALAGSIYFDFETNPLGHDQEGREVFLRDIWPGEREINVLTEKVLKSHFQEEYESVFEGTPQWQELESPDQPTYTWDGRSTYIRKPPFFDKTQKNSAEKESIENAKILALLGDSVTTDHISPAGVILPTSPAGSYLQENNVAVKDFNSYGSRRGNHEVMMRGTLANIRIRNEMVPGVEGGFTRYTESGETLSMYDTAMKWIHRATPLVIIAGKEYGTGSSRDWAAKGVRLLGVEAVIAESFERIHRSNLIGMGVLPLQFEQDETRKTIGFTGEETLTIDTRDLRPQARLKVSIEQNEGERKSFSVICRIDTADEFHYYKAGGILQYVLGQME